jgi:prevent-host-death family protein
MQLLCMCQVFFCTPRHSSNFCQFSRSFAQRFSRSFTHLQLLTHIQRLARPSLRLPLMTISGHNATMRQVRIAELKSRLSEYLRAVRGGETIAVLNRETPVARIVPMRERATLRIRKPAPGTPTPNRVPLPRPVKLRIDVVELLLEERQGHR